MAEPEEQFVKIAVLRNEVEARLLDSILGERSIPHLIRSYYDSAYNGLFQSQKGWGRLDAAEKHKQEILEILEDLRKEQA